MLFYRTLLAGSPWAFSTGAPGPPCAACEWARDYPTTWSPSTDFGVLVTDGPKVADRSVIVARLLVP